MNREKILALLLIAFTVVVSGLTLSLERTSTVVAQAQREDWSHVAAFDATALSESVNDTLDVADVGFMSPVHRALANELSAGTVPAQVTKFVNPSGEVDFRDELTYTVVVLAAPGTRVGFYDPLAGTTFLRFLAQPPGIVHAGGNITGTLTVTPTDQIAVSFVTRVDVPSTAGSTTNVRNRACIIPIGTLDDCIWSNEVINAAFRPHETYLPIVLRNVFPDSNRPPSTPFNPSPADGATGQSVTVDLTWAGGDPDGDGVTYDVYFALDDPTPDVLICNDVASTFCDPGALAQGGHYYWKVVAQDAHGLTATGPVWDFTTGQSVSALTLTSPNGGESWHMGDVHNVTWSSTGSIVNVRLEYSKDGFSSDVHTIVASTPNDGSHAWLVPNDPSVTVRVRVSDASNPSTNDTSNSSFVIYNNVPDLPSNPSPVDGATDQSVTADLSWTGGDPDGDGVTYDVYFALDDPTPDVLICNDVASAFCDPGGLVQGGHYYWKVVAQDAYGLTAIGPVWDFTTGQSVSTLTLTSPNGGESWHTGDVHNVTWSSTGSIANVRLEYSKDGFSSDVHTIVASTPNDGSHAWSVPNDPSVNVRVRVSDASNPSTNDTSNASFVIYNNVPDLPSNPSPVDGATDQSVTVDLSWTGGDPDGDGVTYDVYFALDDPTPDVLICDDVASAFCDPGALVQGGHYYWQVVAQDAYGLTTTGPVWDFITVQTVSTLTLTSPNGGESWHTGDVHNVTWSSTGSIVNVRLEYSKDGFSSDVHTIVSSTPNDGSHAWLVPNDPSVNVRVRMSDASNPSTNDTSNASFVIYNNVPDLPSNPSPADGATDQSVTVDLSWTGGDPDGDSVTYDVYFALDDPTPDVLICNDVASTFCDPGGLVQGGHYYWKVVAQDAYGLTATGPVWDFTTGQPVSTLTLTSPNGGESWHMGDVHNVTWSSTGSIVNVRLEYSKDDFIFDIHTIVASTPNDGSYGWTVPNDPSTSLRVRVSDASNPTTNDKSNASFVIYNNGPNVPSSPSPADGATGQSVDVNLYWTGGDPDGDSVTYDVYLEADDNTPDVLVSDNQSLAAFDPGTLSGGTHYYWQIVSSDEYEAIAIGPVWDFTTEGTGPLSDIRIEYVVHSPPEIPAVLYEKAVLRNSGFAQAMAGWTLEAVTQGFIYEFPADFVFPAAAGGSDAEVTVWVKMGTDTATDLYMGRGTSPVWENPDTAILRDDTGQIVDSLSW